MRTLPRSAAIAAVVLALAACERAGDDGSSPTPSAPSPSVSGTTGTPGPRPTPSGSVSGSPSPTPAEERTVELPPDAPTTLEIDAAPADLPLDRMVPPGADVDGTWILDPPADPSSQIGIVWSRGDDPLFRERGFALWMPFDEPPRWEVVFAFTNPIEEGVLGIRTVEGDLTGDAVPDLLTFEDIGGSGACGTWRVIASGASVASEAFRRQTCDAELAIVGGHLEQREAVFGPGDSHCCPSAYRTTTLEWDGERFVRTDVTESPAPAP